MLTIPSQGTELDHTIFCVLTMMQKMEHWLHGMMKDERDGKRSKRWETKRGWGWSKASTHLTWKLRPRNLASDIQ